MKNISSNLWIQILSLASKFASMKYWWIATYLFRLQTISYLPIDSRPHVKHFLKNHDLSVFDLNLTMSGECVFDKDLFLMRSNVVVHSLEITEIYSHHRQKFREINFLITDKSYCNLISRKKFPCGSEFWVFYHTV